MLSKVGGQHNNREVCAAELNDNVDEAQFSEDDDNISAGAGSPNAFNTSTRSSALISLYFSPENVGLTFL